MSTMTVLENEQQELIPQSDNESHTAQVEGRALSITE